MSKEKRTIVRGNLNGRKFTPQMTIDDWDQTGDLPEIRLEELEEDRPAKNAGGLDPILGTSDVNVEDLDQTQSIPRVNVEDLDQTQSIPRVNVEDLDQTQSIPRVNVEDLDQTRSIPRVNVEDLDQTQSIPRVNVEDLDQTRSLPKVSVEDLDRTQSLPKISVDDLDQTSRIPKKRSGNADQPQELPEIRVDDLDQTMGIFRLGEEKADAKKAMPEFGMEDLGRTSSMSRVLEGFLDSEEEEPEQTAPSGRKPAEEDPDATRALPRLNEDGRRRAAASHGVEIEDLDETRVIPSISLEKVETDKEPEPGEIGEALLQAGQEASAAEAVFPGWSPERPEQRAPEPESNIPISPREQDPVGAPPRKRPPRKPPREEMPEEELPVEADAGRSRKRIVIIAVSVAVVLVLALGGFGIYRMMENKKMMAYYESHFLPATMINGNDCSGMTVEEVKELFSQEVKNYSLTIRGIDGSEDKISAAEIGLVMKFDVDFHGLLDSQDKSGWRKAEENPSSYTFTSGWEYDAKLLKDRIGMSSLFQNMTESKDAEIVYDETAAQFVLNPEVIGTKVDLEQVFGLAESSVGTLQNTLSLEEAGCYPAVVKADEAMAKAVETMNVYLKAKVAYSFGDTTETLTPEMIKSAISYDTAFQVTLDNTVFETWVKGLAEKYNTVGKSRSFRSTKSGTVTVSGGNYGWKMNQEKTLAQILEAVQTGGTVTGDPVYSQEGKSRGSNDIGDTYIEVDLTNQVVYYYENGSRKLSSDVVTGRVIRNTKTVKGVYYIYDKERNRTLKGADYSNDVSYWMPFYGGYGLHDAPWRSSFGGSLYLTNGSHGCVNMPVSKAKSLYNMISEGTPVIVFGGVDSYAGDPEDTTTKAPETTTTVPETTTKTPETTTTAPETTTTAPETTTTAPETTTTVPETTTTEPEITTTVPETSPQEQQDDSSGS